MTNTKESVNRWPKLIPCQNCMHYDESAPAHTKERKCGLSGKVKEPCEFCSYAERKK